MARQLTPHQPLVCFRSNLLVASFASVRFGFDDRQAKFLIDLAEPGVMPE